MAVQTESGVAVSIALGADDGGWLLGLLPQSQSSNTQTVNKQVFTKYQ
jgi:hypothetical protein